MRPTRAHIYIYIYMHDEQIKSNFKLKGQFAYKESITALVWLSFDMHKSSKGSEVAICLFFTILDRESPLLYQQATHLLLKT